MDRTECAWCGTEIEDAGIDHKGMVFCSKECVDDWDEDTLTTDDIDLGDLDDVDFEGEDEIVDELEGELAVGQDDDHVISEDDF